MAKRKSADFVVARIEVQKSHTSPSGMIDILLKLLLSINARKHT